tara:strand:+ start:919 stop:1197 length:279 start_codon:yes stop_codon:yes gene_type:complete
MTPETYDRLHAALSYKEDIDGIGIKGDIDGEAWHELMTQILHYIPDRTFKNAIRELVSDYPSYDLFRDVGEGLGMKLAPAPTQLLDEYPDLL